MKQEYFKKLEKKSFSFIELVMNEQKNQMAEFSNEISLQMKIIQIF